MRLINLLEVLHALAPFFDRLDSGTFLRAPVCEHWIPFRQERNGHCRALGARDQGAWRVRPILDVAHLGDLLQLSSQRSSGSFERSPLARPQADLLKRNVCTGDGCSVTGTSQASPRSLWDPLLATQGNLARRRACHFPRLAGP